MNYQGIYEKIIERGKLRKKVKSDGLHKHRILPGYEGGMYTPSNITYLTRKEHRIIHKIRYKFYGNMGDKIASIWLYSKKYSDDQVKFLIHQGSSLGGKISGNQNKILKKGVCGFTKEQRSIIGKKGGDICKKNKIGIFNLTKEQLQENQKKSNAVKIERIKTDPEFKETLRKNGLKANQYISLEARKRGGVTAGNLNSLSGHTKRIAHLGGAVHKGRRYIVNLTTKKLKRPSLEISKQFVESGEWAYLTST